MNNHTVFGDRRCRCAFTVNFEGFRWLGERYSLKMINVITAWLLYLDGRDNRPLVEARLVIPGRPGQQV